MPIQLFFGDNTLEIDDAVRAIRQTFQSTDALTFDGVTVPYPDLVEACLTAGLFDPDRLVIVRSLHERIKGARKDGGDMEAIRKLFGSIPPTTTLILASPGMPAEHQIVSAIRELGGAVRTYTTPKRNDMPRWIAARARTHRADIDRDAADLLAELVGSNPLMLESELEKLATYAGEERRIALAMVEILVGSVTQDSIFALVDAIAAGDQAMALQLLHAQLAQASTSAVDFAMYLIRMLARQMRILVRLHLGGDAGQSTSQILSELKVPRYYADRYVRQARRLSRMRVCAAFERLAALEHALKSGKADAPTGMDLLVADLCA